MFHYCCNLFWVWPLFCVDWLDYCVLVYIRRSSPTNSSDSVTNANLEFTTTSSPTSSSDGGGDATPKSTTTASPVNSPDSGSADNDAYIIGLVVALLLLVVIVVVVVIIILVVKRRRRKRRSLTDSNMNYSNLRAQEQYDERPPVAAAAEYVDTSDTGTTRSFPFDKEHIANKPEESLTVDQYWSRHRWRHRPTWLPAIASYKCCNCVSGSLALCVGLACS